MQIVYIGDHLHEMLSLVFLEYNKKYHQFVTCWISPESDKS